MYSFRARFRIPGAKFLIVASAAFVFGWANQAQSSDALTISASSRATQWTVLHKGKPVLVYTADPQQFKPYVEALCTTKGYDILRNSPFDHLHHHALMYGIKVNGVNFWEETAGCGVQKVVESSGPTIVTGSRLPTSRLEQLIYWLSPEDAFLPNTNAPALLIERRTLTLVIDEDKQETALHWKSHFDVGDKTNQVTLTGANYHGLGMRFLQELDPVAVHITSRGLPDLANSRQEVVSHPWEAVTFGSDAKPATISVFGADSNARGNAVFFAMKTPFAYLSATQGLDKEPLVYRRGQSFELNYLVTLYPEIKTAEALTKRAKEWNPEAP